MAVALPSPKDDLLRRWTDGAGVGVGERFTI